MRSVKDARTVKFDLREDVRIVAYFSLAQAAYKWWHRQSNTGMFLDLFFDLPLRFHLRRESSELSKELETALDSFFARLPIGTSVWVDLKYETCYMNVP